MSFTKEFGDFQTPKALADEVVELLDKLCPKPGHVIEPTAGLGTFLKAAYEKWGKGSTYAGYEINPEYAARATNAHACEKIIVSQGDFFAIDWKEKLAAAAPRKVLLLGNPPWVNNSTLGSLKSENLPIKTNFQGLRGLDAMTGKANFDISEWMLIRLLEVLPNDGAMAMLCKTATARKVLRHFWKREQGWQDCRIHRIDAKTAFNVSVDACLFFVGGGRGKTKMATLYRTLETNSLTGKFGLIDGELVSDVDAYLELKHLDGGSYHIWRSGLKHDASKVMELTPSDGDYRNGNGEIVSIEPDFVYPLLKSSDLGNGRITPRRSVIVTQMTSGDPTSRIAEIAPKTWQYLCQNGEQLDGRRSSIYRNRPRFAMFGIGPYSFAHWKVAISGLYKSFQFTLLPPVADKPVMVDDTCYSIPCQSEAHAKLLRRILSSDISIRFLKSLVFTDAKRPITVDVLRRLSIVSVAEHLGCLDELKKLESYHFPEGTGNARQLDLLMEAEAKYKTTSAIKKRPS